MRADVYLSTRFEGWSRSKVARAIRGGEVTSDRRPLRPSSILKAGEVLSIATPDYAPQSAAPPCPPVVYEDTRALAFDKPAGLLAHPVGRRFTWGLINLARARYPGEALHLAHRLDRETSGVSLVARGDAANRSFKASFKARLARKTYWAIVRGEIPWDARAVDAPIGDDVESPIRLKRAVTADGQPALTRLRVLSVGGGLSFVSCRPETGRTHQIRVHLDHLGFPILGDRIYGQPPEVFLSIFEGRPLPDLRARLRHPRHCLHARALHIPHPDGGEIVARAPLPDDFAWLLRSVRGTLDLDSPELESP